MSRRLFLLCMSLLMATMAHASLIATVNCNGNYYANECMVASQTTGNSHAIASSSYGVLKGYSYASGVDALGHSAGTTSGFGDTVLFSSPGLDGQVGTMSLSITYTSLMVQDLYTQGSVGGSVYLSFDVLGAASPTVYERDHTSTIVRDSYGTRYTDYFFADDNGTLVPYSTTINATFNFIYGRAMLFRTYLSTSASEQGTGASLTDASHSAYWGGISSVTYNGLPVDYTLTSESGTDWRRSFIPAVVDVSEPANLPIFLPALGFILLIVRRQSNIR